MIKKPWNHKKIRFVCAGCINTLIDLSILNTLVFALHFPVWLGNTVSVGVSVTVSYFLNHYIVFRHHEKPNLMNYLKFFLVTGLSVIILQNIVIALTRPWYMHFLNSADISHSLKVKLALNMAKITAVLVGMVWNFILYSRIVFVHKIESGEEA